MRKSTLLLIILLILSSVFAFSPRLFQLDKLFNFAKGKLVCESGSQFQSDTKGINLPTEKNIVINPSGTINYLKEDFSRYSNNSKVISEFDDLDNLELTGLFSDKKLSSETYSGSHSLSLQTLPSSETSRSLTVKKQLSQPLDLGKWNDFGILSMWMKIADRKGITGVGLKIGDKDNNYREYQEIKNLQVNITNNFDTKDVYPDIELPSKKVNPSMWTDYWLNKGWNYLFWRADKDHYADNGILDIKNITWVEITINENANLAKQEILLDDLRIQDGIEKENNSLGGMWYPPDKKPQNGIFELDNLSNGAYAAKLLNVRQTQYLTNGDHGRMVLNYGTPINFAMKTRFRLTDLPKNNKERVNTWFRVAYDFDYIYDPGHDWFGSFISFEWNKLGLTTIIPIEKDNIQDWEPRNKNISGTSTDFIPRENVLYELDLTAREQQATASIYEVGDNCLTLKAHTDYTFQRPRRGSDERYHFALEVTGNLKAYIYNVEIKEL